MSKRLGQWQDQLLGWAFRLLPHHLLSRVIYYLTRIEGPLVAPVIRWFVRRFEVDLSIAESEDIAHYATFNEFFVRGLKPGARPVDLNENRLISPVDGTVSQCGDIMNDHLIQAKGQFFTVADLLGGDETLAKLFSGGRFATIYLAPHNYHRVHMPLGGRLKQMVHVPGRLFSVAPWTVRTIPRLFARNERLVCMFSTDAGPMAVILVGAMNVAAIETVWSGLVTPPKGKTVSHFDFDHTEKDYSKGEEIARFNMGSTVILLTNRRVTWAQGLRAGIKLKMGQAIATMVARQR